MSIRLESSDKIASSLPINRYSPDEIQFPNKVDLNQIPEDISTSLETEAPNKPHFQKTKRKRSKNGTAEFGWSIFLEALWFDYINLTQDHQSTGMAHLDELNELKQELENGASDFNLAEDLIGLVEKQIYYTKQLFSCRLSMTE